MLEKSGYQALPWVRYITKSGALDCVGFPPQEKSRRLSSCSHLSRGDSICSSQWADRGGVITCSLTAGKDYDFRL